MLDVIYKCTNEITVFEPTTKDQIDIEKGTKWKQTRISSLDNFQELRCDDIVIELPDELVERHFKKL